jgi:superfamily II DNA or RNA helicase
MMSESNGDYKAFLAKKAQAGADKGFEPIWMPDFLFDFQQILVEWALRKGRAAIFADCGLGKTPMSLVWAENVVRKTNRPVLILTPLAVAQQFVREGRKFDIECERSQDGQYSGEIVVSNYERLDRFDPSDFGGCVGDESSRIKHAGTKTRAMVTEFMRQIPYRLLGTATAAPNDWFELGTSSEALGWLGFQDMLTRFFKEDTIKDYLAWGRKTYRFRGHAEDPFWRWVCSWARCCRKPSDLDCDDGSFLLPPLVEEESIVRRSRVRPGTLLPLPARDLREQREERRATVRERCERAFELACSVKGPTVIWCHLNIEGDLLEKIIPDALQVKGSQSNEKKEERLEAFSSGELKRLIIKPKIGAYGLNWQHCSNVICFPGHSFEQYYQAVRRCWRFGQKKKVRVTIIATEGERRILANMQRKAEQADRMFDALVEHASGEFKVVGKDNFEETMEVPVWL